MKYRCKTMVSYGFICKEPCVVDVDFKPQGCLKTAAFQEWEEAG